MFSVRVGGWRDSWESRFMAKSEDFRKETNKLNKQVLTNLEFLDVLFFTRRTLRWRRKCFFAEL